MRWRKRTVIVLGVLAIPAAFWALRGSPTDWHPSEVSRARQTEVPLPRQESQSAPLPRPVPPARRTTAHRPPPPGFRYHARPLLKGLPPAPRFAGGELPPLPPHIPLPPPPPGRRSPGAARPR